MAAVAMFSVAAAQEPAPLPTVPEGVVVTTRAFINGKEVPPAEFNEEIKKVRQSFNKAVQEHFGAAPELHPAPSAAVPVAEPTQVSPPPAAEPEGKAEARESGLRVYVNGKEVQPKMMKLEPVPVPEPQPHYQARPVRKARPAATAGKVTCSHCGKVRRERRGAGPVIPRGEARPFDMPIHDATPPCMRRHGRTMYPAVDMNEGRRPSVDLRKVQAPATSPQAVRVIINGVETVVPIKPEGVNITIKPL